MSKINHRSALLAGLAVAMAAGSSALYPNFKFGTRVNGVKPRTRDEKDREKMTAMQREIADWNAEVDRSKAAKKAAQ